ncbi:MAG: BrnT family toxin [Chromatiales bacterium]|nr:MAG: BrnT family toxin [Chromatiales bacterium]
MTTSRFAWDVSKRRANLRKHGLDFRDAELVFGGVTISFEDNRFAYAERRFVTIGLLRGGPASIVHTESPHEIRIISFRKATKREAALLIDKITD